MKKSATIPEI